MARHDRQSPVDGKLVDTWVYAYKGLEQNGDPEADEAADRPKLVRDQKVIVEVRLDKKTKSLDKPPHALVEVEFVVRCDAPKFKIVGTDIEALRAAAWEKLDDAFEIKWERFYLVRCDDERVYTGLGAGISFNYSDVEKGTAHDGTLLLRQRRWGGDVEVKPWPGEFTDKGGKVTACIPATKPNTKALEEFARRVALLRTAMSDTLRPEKIMLTLQSLGTYKLLPATGDTSNE